MFEAGHAAQLGFGKGINAAALTGGYEAPVIEVHRQILLVPSVGEGGLELASVLAESIGVLTQPCHDEVAALLLILLQVPMADLVWEAARESEPGANYRFQLAGRTVRWLALRAGVKELQRLFEANFSSVE
jgi:hypothetical protein